MEAGASSSPSMVRQGAKRSFCADSVPMRASSPSEITSSSLKVNSPGISRL